MYKIGIYGLGLIGGSIALALKKSLGSRIYGLDKFHQKEALELGLMDSVIEEKNLSEMDVIILATPVDSIPKVALQVLDACKQDALVFDVGSTKSKIAKAIKNHPKRGNYLLAHPIAGTEYSGPQAAFSTLFEGKINIICDVHETDESLLKRAKNIFNKLKMKTIEMNSTAHDKHIAYVSHLSHISSFMLGKTVLDLEENEKNIFQMAGSGFASTVRLAKSSPQTWTPIFVENKQNILIALEEYIDNLNDFKTILYRENKQKLKNILQKTNHIGLIIDKIEAQNG